MTFLLQFFANPLFLVGLGAAAIPLVLHLMHRRKAVEIPFPSLRYLRLSQNRSARRKRLEELLLLLIRMLALACLAMALAGPFFGNAGLGAGGEPCAVAIVLDTSYSMSLTEGPAGRHHTRLEVAQRIAGLTLQDLVNNQSQACLIPTALQFESAPPAAPAEPAEPAESGQPAANGAPVAPATPTADAATWANAGQLSGRIDRVREFIWQAQAGGAPADLKAAVVKALQQLDASPLRRKELYILSDLQRSDWEPALAALTDRPADAIQVAVFDVREQRPEDRRDTANLAIEKLTLTARQKRIGAPVVVAGRLHNYADRELRVRVSWDWGRLPQGDAPPAPATPATAPAAPGTPGDHQPAAWLQQNHLEKEITIPPNATADVTFETVFKDKGVHVGRLSAGQDSLPIDNARYAVQRVTDQIPVAIVPNPREHVFYQSSAFFLQSALDPFGAKDPKGRKSAFAVNLVTPQDLPKADLSAYAAVIFAGVDSFAPDTVKRLTAYVQQGGGLVIFPAEGADTDRLTQQLGVLEETDFGPGGGLLPGAYGERFGDPSREEGGETVRIQDHEHPAVLAFRGRFADLLTAVVVRAGVDVRVADRSPARTLLATADGRPLLVSLRIGRGEVVQWGTSCDGRWGNLAITNVFPVLMHDLVMAMSDAGVGGGSQPLGSLSTRGAELAPGPVTIYTPDGRIIGAQHSALQPATWTACTPGFYELAGVAGRRDVVAANLDTEQSDLAALAPDSVQTALAWSANGRGPMMAQGSVVEAGAGGEINANIAAMRSGYQASRDLLMLALILFLAELVLAERFFKSGAGAPANGAQLNTAAAAVSAETTV